jgi:hypothetical protein
MGHAETIIREKKRLVWLVQDRKTKKPVEFLAKSLPIGLIKV